MTPSPIAITLATPVPFIHSAELHPVFGDAIIERSSTHVRQWMLLGGTIAFFGVLPPLLALAGGMAAGDMGVYITLSLAAAFGVIVSCIIFAHCWRVRGRVRVLRFNNALSAVEILSGTEGHCRVEASAGTNDCALLVGMLRMNEHYRGIRWKGLVAAISVCGTLYPVAARKDRKELEYDIESMPRWIRSLARKELEGFFYSTGMVRAFPLRRAGTKAVHSDSNN